MSWLTGLQGVCYSGDPDKGTAARAAVIPTGFDMAVMAVTNLWAKPCDRYEMPMEAPMPVHTFMVARKRRAVEFRSTRSPRDLLLSLPIVDGDMRHRETSDAGA